MKSNTEIDGPRPSRAVAVFGTSVRGPRHTRENHCNDDSWLGRRFTNGSMICVSDGMGTRPRSGIGAQEACRSAAKAARLWLNSPSVPAEWVCRWIEADWRFAVSPEKPGNCATTCLAATWHAEAGLLFTGLGDGMALLKEGKRSVRCLSKRRDDHFADQTLGLGADHQLSDWVCLNLPNLTAPWLLALVTDGIADDLREDKLDLFVSWLQRDVGPKPPNSRVRMLQQALRDWPTPGHSDDKTIAVLLKY